jgi:hypothetical protein
MKTQTQTKKTKKVFKIFFVFLIVVRPEGSHNIIDALRRDVAPRQSRRFAPMFVFGS